MLTNLYLITFTELNFPDFTKDDLQKLGITTLGDITNILCKQKTLTFTTAQSDTNPSRPSLFMKTPAAKLPQLIRNDKTTILKIQNRLGCLQTYHNPS